MKKIISLLLLALAVLNIPISCTEEEPPVRKIEPDSGVYDPTSYFPLKWGARWVYETKSGMTFTVNCGGHYVDTLRQHHHKFPYDYHLLSTDTSVYYGKPSFNGKYWNAAEVGGICSKGAPISVALTGGTSPGLAMPAWMCGINDPNSDLVICVDSAIQKNGYSQVYSYVYVSENFLASPYDSVKTQLNSRFFTLPILPTSGTTLVKAYYAPGVGLILKELINESGQVADYFVLKSYFFP